MSVKSLVSSKSSLTVVAGGLVLTGLGVWGLVHGWFTKEGAGVHLLINQPLLLLFVLLAVGTIVGMIRFFSVSIGAAAVLFTAIAFSAYNANMAVPKVVGDLGLALFAYCIGVTAGASFFASLRKGIRPVIAVAVTLVGCAGIALGLGKLLDLSQGTIAGVFAGAVTNTPAMGAAATKLGAEHGAEVTTGYAVTYLGGVVIMLLTAIMALRSSRQADAGETEKLTNMTIRVTNENLPPLCELEHTAHGRVLFSRIKHDGVVGMAQREMVPQPHDRVLAIGKPSALRAAAQAMGRESTLPLHLERTAVDYRRIMLSRPQHFGRMVWELDLGEKFGATATRVRRADQDMLAEEDLVLQPGDRIRVAAPREKMGEVAKYLGDSEHGASDINPLGFATGLAVGLLLGAWKIPLPVGEPFELGMAAGPLLVGLVLGRVGRTGRVVWALPHQSSQTISHLGMLLFLAYAGGRAGAGFLPALRDQGPKLLLVGAVVTAFEALVLMGVARWLDNKSVPRLAGPRLAGMLAGSQTQPAILAYANDRTSHDQRVALGYALVYPIAMVTKILLAQFLAG